MKTILTLTFFLMCPVFAGDEVGNGGDAVVCKMTKESSPRLLDFTEYNSSSFTFSPIEEKDEYQIVKKVFTALAKLSPKLSKKYLRDLKEFRLKVKLISDENFRDVKDSHQISLPKGCELKQLAIQKKNPLTQETEISINKDLYDQMTPLHRAGLISHEIIYEHFLFFNVRGSLWFKMKGSEKVRIFNRYLFSKEIKNHKKADFIQLSENLEIPLD